MSRSWSWQARRSAGRRRAGCPRERVEAEECVLAAVALVEARSASAARACSRTRRTCTSRGPPRGRYGVSICRCETQPQAVAARSERAQPTMAPGNSAQCPASPAPPGIGRRRNRGRRRCRRRLLPAAVARAAGVAGARSARTTVAPCARRSRPSRRSSGRRRRSSRRGAGPARAPRERRRSFAPRCRPGSRRSRSGRRRRSSSSIRTHAPGGAPPRGVRDHPTG